jgi:large subunit ribosomal protein L5
MAGKKQLSLKEKYETKVKPNLAKTLGLKNHMALPRLEKIVINVGAGKAKEDSSFLDELTETLATITGQRPVITKSKTAISNFKIREGMPIGLKVTLRRHKMWDFLDKLINISLPRTKDFRGLSPKSFDGQGNYSLGITDQTIFPEIDTSKNIRLHGMQISIITSANNDETSLKFLKELGMPFRKN